MVSRQLRTILAACAVVIWLVSVYAVLLAWNRETFSDESPWSLRRKMPTGYSEASPETLPKVSHPRAIPVVVSNASVGHTHSHGSHSAPSQVESKNVTHTAVAHEDHHREEEDHENGAPVVEIEQLAEAHVVPLQPLLQPTADVPACVNEDFGPKLIERWRDAGKPYCMGTTAIRCHRIFQARHAGHDNFCTMADTVFDPRSGGDMYIDCRADRDVDDGAGRMQTSLFPPDMMKWYARLRHGPLPTDVKRDDTPTILAWRDCNAPYNPFTAMAIRSMCICCCICFSGTRARCAFCLWMTRRQVCGTICTRQWPDRVCIRAMSGLSGRKGYT